MIQKLDKPLIISTVVATCPACEGEQCLCGSCCGTGHSRRSDAFACGACGGQGVVLCAECGGTGEVEVESE